MKFFVVVSAFLAIASAGVVAPIALPTILATVPLTQHSSQYHSQDILGQYSYGYANDQSAKNEIKSLDGQTVGSYSYVDAYGKLQQVQYRSDAVNGFRVAATNLPVGPSPAEPIKETPEVAEAKAKHLEALKSAAEPVIHAHPAVGLIRAVPTVAAPSFGYSYGINFLNPQPFVTAYTIPTNQQIVPEAPKDLPEVVEARTKHLETFESVKKSIEEQQQRQTKE
ncbi:unnamed protein product [Ceutorhynchus assimilis]|uniref:Cuticle protein 6 n=1 Tax=Ceutorhynchus assimilis TaxID=467358 RepID=A0A9N9QQM7_9CUCU|nr:unnamed protein product [Ceutorhynchus assimilis]